MSMGSVPCSGYVLELNETTMSLFSIFDYVKGLQHIQKAQYFTQWLSDHCGVNKDDVLSYQQRYSFIEYVLQCEYDLEINITHFNNVHIVLFQYNVDRGEVYDELEHNNIYILFNESDLYVKEYSPFYKDILETHNLTPENRSWSVFS